MSKSTKEMSQDYERSFSKLQGTIRIVVGALFVLALVVTFAHLFGRVKTKVTEDRGQTTAERSVRAQEERAAASAAAAATQARIDSARRNIEGVWQLVGGADSPVYVGDYTIDRSGNLQQFQFEFSFVGSNGRAYSNTWDCSLTRSDRYDCTYRQRWDGGSMRENAVLERKDSDTFTGRYMYQNQWRDVTFRKRL